jgi:hypothetical protein
MEMSFEKMFESQEKIRPRKAEEIALIRGKTIEGADECNRLIKVIKGLDDSHYMLDEGAKIHLDTEEIEKEKYLANAKIRKILEDAREIQTQKSIAPQELEELFGSGKWPGK